ncbi:transcription repressor OFP13-like [Salvia hispanica]|uniref:transcription repressor OFP13-like n=1 Tax=Salvia hispanica TaxID=49212 RepID=UPI002009BCAF|nr:transcription repressor OFP13-like [Salvia hispanica]
MVKKNKFPFLFKGTTASAVASPWPCANSPKTLSFRANADTNLYKTINSAYLDGNAFPDSFFSIRRDESAVIGGLRSDRLFFDPGETSSILAEAFPYGERVRVMAMDSNDPFLDFRSSMAEMVEAHGLKSWGCLEELLTCYLRVNEKANHGYIVGAFVDLLIHLSLREASETDDQCSAHYSFTSPLSFSSSTATYSSISPALENDDEVSAPDASSECFSDQNIVASS